MGQGRAKTFDEMLATAYQAVGVNPEQQAQINQMAVTTTENVVKTSDSIENLSLLSQELKNSVSGFKLPVGY